jgi:hypothetical protein
VASAVLLAGEGEEYLVLVVTAANSRIPFLQIAALEKGGHRLLDDRHPVAIPGLIAFVGDPPKGVTMLTEQSPQVGGLRIAWAVERPGLDTSGDHGRNRKVYRIACTLYENTCTTVVEPSPTSQEQKRGYAFHTASRAIARRGYEFGSKPIRSRKIRRYLGIVRTDGRFIQRNGSRL